MHEQSTHASVSEQAEVEYRDIPGFPGYRAGSDGSIWSCWWRGRQKQQASWRQRALRKNRDGYYVVTLHNRVRSVHRLVLSAFIGSCPDGMCCRHINGDPADNRPENLCWDTIKANAADRASHGTENRGERNGNAKLTTEQVVEIRTRAARGESQSSLAKSFSVRPPTICRILSGHNWRDASAHPVTGDED